MFDRRLIEFAVAKDPDAVLVKHLRNAVGGASPDDGVGRSTGQRSDRMNLLLAGYLGAGNVGSDMRCNELVRQVRHLLGGDRVSFGALAISPRFPADVLQDVKPVLFEGYVPDAVARAVDAYDGVIACEGSMFKSHFSNVLSAVMAAALGRAVSTGKLAVGYGAEIGAMTPALQEFVVEQAAGAPIFCRTSASRDCAVAIGLDGRPGADTAWTFEAAPPAVAETLLRERGWDGRAPVLVVCPTNPFWWPVRADPAMALKMQQTGEAADLCYGSIFFHADSDEIRGAYRRYVIGLAAAIAAIVDEQRAFPVLVAMEPVDRRVCQDLAQALPQAPPIVVGQEHRIGDVVSLLRRASLLISSRFHALVGSFPALTPAIGVATDERIRYLLTDAGGGDRLINASDPELCDRIVQTARQIDPEVVAASCRQAVGRELRAMGEMGMAFVEEVRRRRPDFEIPDRPARWQDHLPPLSPTVSQFL